MRLFFRDGFVLGTRFAFKRDGIRVAAEWLRLGAERVIVDIREQGLVYEALAVERDGFAERKLPWEIA